MTTVKYRRKNARAILTRNERKFLINFPKDRPLSSNERHFKSSIENKTRKTFQDLNLILEKYPNSYLLFSELNHPSLMNPIIEVTRILYGRNYRREFSKRLKNKVKRQVNKDAIRRQTKKQLIRIIDSVLDSQIK